MAPSLEAEKILKAANNLTEGGASYQKTPFPWLLSAKKNIFLPLVNP